ncbi:MAG: hypothetical protein DHS80DRAFT_18332 [Piptocephalis tieghemiana]|nr:MAG: hypothetical protein DHS80DRAFT_18332 [Piptocephalis tieghemiana]
MLKLPCERAIFVDFSSEEEGALSVLAHGLPLDALISHYLAAASVPEAFVLVLGMEQGAVSRINETLFTLGASPIRYLTNETSIKDRQALYLKGGVIAVTSRILVVDMLLERLPIHLVTGLVVLNAHRVRAESTEAFIIRLYRQGNTQGFVRAFSDAPERLSPIGRFSSLEKSMKALSLRKVQLWPRFHLTIKEDLEGEDRVVSEVIELRQPMTRSMRGIQAGLVDCLESTLAELRRASSRVEVEEMTLDMALSKSLDQIVRRQLDPVWHQLSARTKGLVSDLTALRSLLSYLIVYDAVSFLSYLETIAAASSPGSSALTTKEGSPWLFMDASDTVFTLARRRVYTKEEGDGRIHSPGLPPGIKPVLETQPKWSLFLSILDELRDQVGKEKDEKGSRQPYPILVMCAESRTCDQLGQLLEEWKGKGKDEDLGSKKAQVGQSMMMTRLRRYFTWKRSVRSLVTTGWEGGAREVIDAPIGPRTFAGDGARGQRGGRGGWRDQRQGGQIPSYKRRRVRGASQVATSPSTRSTTPSSSSSSPSVDPDERESGDQEPLEKDPLGPLTESHPLLTPQIDHLFSPYFGLLTSQEDQIIHIRSYQGGGEDEQMLEDLCPQTVILYDATMEMVRQLEFHQARHQDHALYIYFLTYAESVEEQQYLGSVRREKEAFERLIQESSVMSIPLDVSRQAPSTPGQGEEEVNANTQYLRSLSSRIAGGGMGIIRKEHKVIVDMREFRSSLPGILHAQSYKVIPCTLEIGDYILSPEVCVERKSISDLIQSFSSGRLFNQVEKMTTYYKTPVLLIEFDEAKAFSLQVRMGAGRGRDDISLADLSSKITLLLLHFPRLRVLWSSSPMATSEMFQDLQINQEEPDARVASRVGIDRSEEADKDFNPTPQDILRSLPGITSSNYWKVMRRVRNLRSLMEMTLEELTNLLGPESAGKLHEFIHQTGP